MTVRFGSLAPEPDLRDHRHRVARNRGYIAFGWLKATASVLLAVFLWWLALLGVNLHVH